MNPERFKRILSYPSYAMMTMLGMSDEEIIEHFKAGPIEAPVKVTGMKLLNYISVWGNSTVSRPTNALVQRFSMTLLQFPFNAMGGHFTWQARPGEELIFFDIPEIVFDPPDKLGLCYYAVRFQDSETGYMEYNNMSGLMCL